MENQKTWLIDGEQRVLERTFGIKYEQLLIKLLRNAGEVLVEGSSLAIWLLSEAKAEEFIGIVTRVMEKEWTGARVKGDGLNFEMLVEVSSDFLDTITDVLKTSLIRYAAILDVQKERQRMLAKPMQTTYGK